MHRLKLFVGVLLVFVLGTLAGTIGTRHFLRQRIVEFARGGPPGGPPGGMILRRILDDLDLAATQKVEIDKIVDETEARLLAFEREHHPEFLKIFDDGISLIKGQLDDQQKKEMDRLLEKMRHRLSRPFLDRAAHLEEIMKGIFAEEKKRLNLTPDQEAKIRQIFEAWSRRRHEIVGKYTGKLPREMPSFMEEIRNYEESMERDLGAILDPEQMKAFRRLREEQAKRMMHADHPRRFKNRP